MCWGGSWTGSGDGASRGRPGTNNPPPPPPPNILCWTLHGVPGANPILHHHYTGPSPPPRPRLHTATTSRQGLHERNPNSSQVQCARWGAVLVPLQAPGFLFPFDVSVQPMRAHGLIGIGKIASQCQPLFARGLVEGAGRTSRWVHFKVEGPHREGGLHSKVKQPAGIPQVPP